MASVRIGGARVDITGQSASLEKAMRRAAAAYDRQERDLKRLRAQARRTSKAYVALGRTAAGIGGLALGGLGISSGIKTIASFEQAIADLSAITGAAGKDLAELEKRSLELASSSTYTGSEVADAYKLVASAKPDLLESTKALTEVTDATLTLAEAAGIQLTDAATAVGATLNQFGLASSEAARVVNVLAAGSKYGAASIADIAKSMKVFGVSAADASISVEEATAAVEALAAVNIRGEEAGSALRNIFLILDTHIDKQLRPSVVGLTTALTNLNAKQLDGAALVKLFGRENVNAAKQLLGNVDLVKQLIRQVTATNVAFEQAATRTETLTGKTDMLASAWERFLNTIADSSTWKAGLDLLTKWINKTSEAIEKAEELRSRGVAPPGAEGMRVGGSLLAASGASVLGKLLGDYERVSKRVTELGEHATQHQIDRLDELQKRIDRINDSAGPMFQGPAPTIRMPSVETEPVGAATIPDAGYYTDPYGPQGLEKAYERELEILGVLEDQKARDIIATQRQREANQAHADAVDAATEALAKERAEIERRARAADAAYSVEGSDSILQAIAEQNARVNEQHRAAVAERLKVEEAATAEVLRQADAVRDAQVKAAKDAQVAWENMANSIGDHFANAFGEFAAGTASAKEAFRSFAEGLIQEMIRIQAQAAAAQILGFLGSLFAPGAPSGWIPTGGGDAVGGYGIPGARAGGGPVSAGRAYIVGEEGPELFVPRQSGGIVPNNAMGGTGGGGGFTINVTGVQDPSAIRAEVLRLLPAIGAAEDARFYRAMTYPNQKRNALRGGVFRG